MLKNYRKNGLNLDKMCKMATAPESLESLFARRDTDATRIRELLNRRGVYTNDDIYNFLRNHNIPPGKNTKAELAERFLTGIPKSGPISVRPSLRGVITMSHAVGYGEFMKTEYSRFDRYPVSAGEYETAIEIATRDRMFIDASQRGILTRSCIQLLRGIYPDLLMNEKEAHPELFREWDSRQRINAVRASIDPHTGGHS